MQFTVQAEIGLGNIQPDSFAGETVAGQVDLEAVLSGRKRGEIKRLVTALPADAVHHLDKSVRIGRVFADVHARDNAPALLLAGIDQFEIPAFEERAVLVDAMVEIRVER